MKTLVTRASTYAAAALATAWPGSTAAREAQRLARDGHDIRAVHDVDFSLAFDEPAAALGAIGAAGFGPATRTRQETSAGSHGSGLPSDVAPAA